MATKTPPKEPEFSTEELAKSAMFAPDADLIIGCFDPLKTYTASAAKTALDKLKRKKVC